MASENVLDISDADFQEKVLGSAVPVVVDFWAEWCGPCRMMSPVLDEVAKAYGGKVTFVKMNVDENPQTPGKYGVRSIPNLKLFKAGEVLDEIVGAVPRQKLEAMVEKAL
ncbi:MAG: thioredoxin [Deltaproteobacteria bacterium]|nr:thioredoxin [Deltaproteobacteria bacterium]